MNRRISFLIVLVIGGLIMFDSAQQQYYLKTFNLNPENSPTYFDLLRSHLVRWVIWGVTILPAALFSWRKYFLRQHLTPSAWVIVIASFFLLTSISIVGISMQSIVSQQAASEEFFEFFQFFLYQKGLGFLMASSMLILLLYNESRALVINSQMIEIDKLEKQTSDLQEVIGENQIPSLHIKVGYKQIPIHLADIIWIQSDDYCVKIHVEDKSYTLRESLKSLESKLSPFGFIRIHRTALLNMKYLEQINYENSKIKLTNNTEIPFSKKGIRSLKKSSVSDSS